MDFQTALGRAIRDVRTERKFTQESLTAFSSRSYLSEIENGKSEASLAKINELAKLIDIHPLAILTMAYLNFDETQNVNDVITTLKTEIARHQK